MLRLATKYRGSQSMMTEIALFNKANDPELDHWLSPQSRCFGDKGDVEDITEG